MRLEAEAMASNREDVIAALSADEWRTTPQVIAGMPSLGRTWMQSVAYKTLRALAKDGIVEKRQPDPFHAEWRLRR